MSIARCKYCGQEHDTEASRSHLGVCKVLRRSLVDENDDDNQDLEIVDITAYVMQGNHTGAGRTSKCRIVKGRKVCKVKSCYKPVKKGRGLCEKHQREKARAEKKKQDEDKCKGVVWSCH